MKHGPKLNNLKKGTQALHKQKLKDEAIIRRDYYDKLTADEKIARLDAKGFTAEKERFKIAKEHALKTQKNTLEKLKDA